MTNSINGMDGAQELLIKLVEQNPEDWTTRKKVVQVMYDAGFYRDASKMIWGAPEIPPAGEEVIFAARIVSKGQPTRAMRLFSTLIDNNMAQPAENLAMAKLLVKAGMPHQAIRFYGAATALDSGLADETFELSLVAVDDDSKNKSWGEFVSSEDFSWDGPDENAGQPVDSDEVTNTYAELLNGATQPVPMKAPAREKIERSNELPTWSIEKTKTSYIPQEILEPSAEMSKPTLEPEPEFVPTPKPRFVEDVVPSAIVEPISEPVYQPSAPAVYLPEVVSTDEVIEDAPEDKKEEAFFKSYDEAHDHQSEVVAEKVSDGFDGVSAPTVMAPAPISSPTPAASPSETVEMATANLPGKEVEAVVSESGDESLADYVAGVLSDIDDVKIEEDQPSKLKNRVVGVFSSLVKKVRRQSDPTETDDRRNEENFTRISEDHENQPVAKESKLESVPVIETVSAIEAAPQPNVSVQPPQPKVEERVAIAPERDQQTNVPASTGKVVPKPMEERSKPRELDGRTQLVALAPQNGSAYFTQLLERYNQHPDGELPKPAVLARDMANVDYLGLIGEACGKNLDAFSKLLGLHRVMSSGGCREWVDDMNLLRKGYGDAVLATVVSKYSISECREILNSVYSSPAPQAAAV